MASDCADPMERCEAAEPGRRVGPGALRRCRLSRIIACPSRGTSHLQRPAGTAGATLRRLSRGRAVPGLGPAGLDARALRSRSVCGIIGGASGAGNGKPGTGALKPAALEDQGSASIHGSESSPDMPARSGDITKNSQSPRDCIAARGVEAPSSSPCHHSLMSTTSSSGSPETGPAP